MTYIKTGIFMWNESDSFLYIASYFIATYNLAIL